MTPEEILKKIKEESAFHEAGHAVAMAWLSLPFIHVIVVSDEVYGALGRVHCSPGRFERDDFTDLAISCAAGKAAVDLWAKLHGYGELGWEDCGAANDLAQIEHLGQRVAAVELADGRDLRSDEFEGLYKVSDSGDGIVAVVQPGFTNYVYRYATDILCIPYEWAAVEELARRLNESFGEPISHEEVHRILQSCKA
jgi:hypothetical protein